MERTYLGTTGLSVSRAWLGTATFGIQADEETSHAVLDEAFELGIDVIDTANVYPLGGDMSTRGRTEEIVGRWLKGRRDEVLVATKFFGTTGGGPWRRGNNRANIIASAEESLRRLAVDHIDLYQAHHYDPNTPIDETLSALDHLVTAGKVRYLGWSNALAYQVMKSLGRSEARNLAAMVSVQPRYSLLSRQAEVELLPMCREEGLGVVPFNVLAGGLLTGKHRYDAPPPADTRFGVGTAAQMYQDRYWRKQEFETVGELQAVADEAGVPLLGLAIAWICAQDGVTAPILGASRPGQLGAAVTGVEMALDPEVLSRVDDITVRYRHTPQT